MIWRSVGKRIGTELVYGHTDFVIVVTSLALGLSFTRRATYPSSVRRLTFLACAVQGFTAGIVTDRTVLNAVAASDGVMPLTNPHSRARPPA